MLAILSITQLWPLLEDLTMSEPTVTASELKNRLGEYLDASRTEPIIITKSGREVAALVSIDLYQHLLALEDFIWGWNAEIAAAEGSLGVEETARFMAKMMAKTVGEAC
jgi:prevent-host-death family protein